MSQPCVERLPLAEGFEGGRLRRRAGERWPKLLRHVIERRDSSVSVRQQGWRPATQVEKNPSIDGRMSSRITVARRRLTPRKNEGLDSKIRKQVYDLTKKDLLQCAVWEFALDEEDAEGQDEATVRPRPDLQSAPPEEGMFVVRTGFLSYDGARYIGYATPTDREDLGYSQPTVVTDEGQVTFLYGAVPPTAEDKARAYRLLDKRGESLFPLTFRSSVPTGRVSLHGTIAGFLHSGESGEVRESF